MKTYIDSLKINFFEQGIADLKALSLWLRDNQGIKINMARNNKIDDYILKRFQKRN